MIEINLSNKIAIVTGASGQLGRVMVRILARAGADVVIHYYRNKRKAEELLSEVETMNVRGMTMQADITDQDSVLAMRDKVFQTLGHPHIIVNNSVIQYRWMNVLDQPPVDFENQFRSCVMHNVFMIKAFVPAMIERGWGRVIGISTECVMQCWQTQSAYVSGKRGMDGVLRVLAREVGSHGITVNQVAPGWMISEDRKDTGTDYEKWHLSNVPLKRWGDAQEIANVVVFLASDLVSYISGAYIPVCGGNIMPVV